MKIYNYPEPWLDDHGGGCCGVRHLWNFECYNPSHYSLDQKIYGILQRVLKRSEESQSKKIAFEIVLNQHQIRGWKRALELSGFERVYSFRNGNTGNRCYVYYTHLSKNDARRILESRGIEHDKPPPKPKPKPEAVFASPWY